MTHEEMDVLIKSGNAECYECEEQIDTTDADNFQIVQWFRTKDVDIRCMRCWYSEKYDVCKPQLDYNDLD